MLDGINVWCWSPGPRWCCALSIALHVGRCGGFGPFRVRGRAASGNGLQIENRRTIKAGKDVSDPRPTVLHFHGSVHLWGGDPSAPWAAVPIALAG